MFVTTKHHHFSFHINNKNNLPKPENPIRTSIESEVSLSFLKSALKKKKTTNHNYNSTTFEVWAFSHIIRALKFDVLSLRLTQTNLIHHSHAETIICHTFMVSDLNS